MKHFVLIILFYIAVGGAAITGSQWHLGNWFGPEFPENTQELSTWSVRELDRLENSMDCNQVPVATNDEHTKVMLWRSDCAMVADYWGNAYRKAKIEAAKDRFK